MFSGRHSLPHIPRNRKHFTLRIIVIICIISSNSDGGGGGHDSDGR